MPAEAWRFLDFHSSKIRPRCCTRDQPCHTRKHLLTLRLSNILSYLLVYFTYFRIHFELCFHRSLPLSSSTLSHHRLSQALDCDRATIIDYHRITSSYTSVIMPGGKGKSVSGKVTGAKDSGSKNQKSHSAKAGLQVSRLSIVMIIALAVLGAHG